MIKGHVLHGEQVFDLRLLQGLSGLLADMKL